MEEIGEIKTLEMAPTDDAEINDLLKEGWEVFDVKIVQLTEERTLEGSPYVGTRPRVVWVLGRSYRHISLEDIPEL